MSSLVLKTAKLDWRNANTPVSSHYDDIYFSSDDGCAESHYVFIQHNDLEQRFQSLDKTHFTIAETGFGTGLNFLQTWHYWQQHKREGQKLYYISAECYPLSKSDLKKSLDCWPQYSELSKILYENYPPAIRGIHCIELTDGVTLILLLDEAVNGFNGLIENQHPSFSYDKSRAVDAWFLDGFAPSKNPDMWTDELFNCMAQLSHRNTSFASFTAAGIVRRGLQSAGFEVTKVKGFGKKRDMIRGKYTGLPIQTNNCTPTLRSRPYNAFWPIYRNTKNNRPKTALIIGAGIAGISTAKTLADAGIKVTLIDKNSDAMLEASGNPQGVLFPKLSHEQSNFSEFNLLSLLYAKRFYQEDLFKEGFKQCGMLQIVSDKELNAASKLVEQFSTIDNFVSLIDATKASEISNTLIQDNCLWYPETGWLRPESFRKAFQKIKNIVFYGNTEITHLEKKSGIWLAQSSTGEIFKADNIIIANAFSANKLLPELKLPLKNIRGQITQFTASGYKQIETVICHDGYICPIDNKSNDKIATYTCGASYELNDNDAQLKNSSQQYNIDILKKHLPDFNKLNISTPTGRVNFRCSAPDYMPIVGPVPDTKAFINNYAAYAKNANAYIPQTGTYRSGLFVNIAYGSRGFSSAPIGAALIKAYLLQQCYPLPYNIITALNPARFLIRDIKRRKYT